jgi:hypothetical protein
MKGANSETLLKECREFMTYRMRSSMSRMMSNVEDTLFEMATADNRSVQASHFIDAVREIRMKKREIQVRFENRFMSLFDDGVRQIREGDRMNIFSPVHMDYAAKVVDMNIAETRAIENTMERVRSECRSALSDLDRHVSVLLDAEKFDHFDNPMQPKTVFDAFWESCRDIQAGVDVRLILVQMFEKHVASDLQNLYEDLNKLFASYISSNQTVLQPVSEEKHDGSVDGEVEGDYEGRRQSVLVRSWVKDKVLARMNGAHVPEFVREFLLQPWCLVLEKIYEKQGENSLAWVRAMQLVDDLILSVQVAVDKDSRRQQIWMLPGLIYRLKNGMKSAAIPLKDQAEFLSKLKAHQVRITEAALGSTQPR